MHRARAFPALNEKGRARIGSILLLGAVVAGVYYGIEVGGVFFRKLKLEEAVQQHLSFAGQLENEAIRQQILGEVRAMNLPPEAQRIGLVDTGNPRVMRVTIAYTETVNLIFTRAEIPVRIQVNRRF